MVVMVVVLVLIGILIEGKVEGFWYANVVIQVIPVRHIYFTEHSTS